MIRHASPWLLWGLAASIAACGPASWQASPPEGKAPALEAEAGKAVPSPKGSAQPETRQVEAFVVGLASWDGPVVGAKVRLVGLDGQALGTETTHGATTYPSGAYVIATTTLPEHFRVEVTGGTVQGQPWEGSLRAEVRGYHMHQGYVPINPITTMVSAYMDRHPEASLSQAQARVRGAFQLPPGLDLGHGLAKSPRYFDGAAAWTQVQAAGGLAPWVRQGLGAMEAGQSLALHRQAPLALMDATDTAADIVFELMKALASGAVGAVGANLANRYLGFLFNPGGGQAEALAQFQGLEDQVSALQLQLGSVEATLKSEIDAAQYQNDPTVATLGAFQAANEYVSNTQLTLLQADLTSTPSQDVAARLGSYIDTNYPDDLVERWDGALRGVPAGGKKGAIQLWNEVVNANSPLYFTVKMAGQVGDWWSWWDVVQAKAIAIKVSRYHQVGAAPALVSQLLTQYGAKRKAQLQSLRGMPKGWAATPQDLSALQLPAEQIAVSCFPATWGVVVQKRNPITRKTLVWRNARDFISANRVGTLITIGAEHFSSNDASYRQAVEQSQAHSEVETRLPAASWRAAGYQDLVGLFDRSVAGNDLAAAGFYEAQSQWSYVGIACGRDAAVVDQLNKDWRAWWIDPNTGATHIATGKGGKYSLLMNQESTQRFTY